MKFKWLIEAFADLHDKWRNDSMKSIWNGVAYYVAKNIAKRKTCEKKSEDPPCMRYSRKTKQKTKKKTESNLQPIN